MTHGRTDSNEAREYSGDSAGNGAVRSERPAVRFGFITDLHYAKDLPSAWGRHYSESLAKARAFVDAMNSAKVDFIMEGGDLKDLGSTPDESLANLDLIEAELARFKGPRYHVLGNHDHDNITKEEFLAHIENSGQRQTRSFYSFDAGAIRFIVLDGCYRPDAVPYCRGNFNWEDSIVPGDQIAFLKAALDSAPGACIPVIHQQLDAEDCTVVRNAARVRRILEESGKVKCVIQGHYHDGSFRVINGIGYYSQKAAVLDSEEHNAWSTVEVYPSGDIRICGHAPAASISECAGAGWKSDDLAWRSGHWQVHYIYTGRGESIFHIFPDGRSMLLDCGDSMRFYNTPAETPHLPDISRRAGEWVARYVRRVNPHDDKVDIFHLSHYHEDHGGGLRWNGGELGKSRLGPYYLCGLADAARFLTFGEIIDRASPTFNDPGDLLAPNGEDDGTARQMQALYAALHDEKGTKIRRFELGARNHFGELEIFNLCSCGRYVRKDGSVRDLFQAGKLSGEKVYSENAMSCGMIMTMGKFRYFTAGDFSGTFIRPDGTYGQIEDELAEAVCPVDVAKLTHHGHHSMSPGLVKALHARVWTSCTLDQAHCTTDTMARLADTSLYEGPRDIIPTFTPYTFQGAAQAVTDEPCHVILDVVPGGEHYTISCIAAATEEPILKAQYGYTSRG